MEYLHKPIKQNADLSQFWVITCISNPERFKRRFELFWRFKELCDHAKVKLITVEQAFGNRDFLITKPDNLYDLQVRSESQIWLKENLINLGVKHAQHVAAQTGQKVREVAWIDADCRPARTPEDWFKETWHQLQHYDFVQMWEQMIDLDINHNVIGRAQPGFMANYIKYGTPTPKEFHKIESKNKKCYPYGSSIFGRPGLAWAARIDALDKVGGLIDFCILGAGDWYMAHGLIGTLQAATNEYACGPYQQKLFQWQERAVRHLKKNVGYVSGMVYHDFHGKKANRKYGTRGKILADCKFNPDTDLKYDSYGMLQLEVWDERQIKLRDLVRGYFRARNEDSIDL